MQTSSFEQVIKVLLKKGVIAQGDDVVLANSCSIILTKDENKPNLVYVDIQYKATLPPDLFYKIYNFFVCNTIYNVSCNKIAPTNIDDIKKYVSVFCKANNLNELIFSSSVQDKFIDNELLITLINDKYYSI
ncbi:hypothetical protein FACS189496_4010 [Bacilli bacterium]|nr:hypothetical protein FACS189496_4010 [Bacilli bacterium]